MVRSLAEQNVVFMTLLRALCEQKQMKHTHTISKDKKEVWNVLLLFYYKVIFTFLYNLLLSSSQIIST